MAPCEDCHRLERLLNHSADVAVYAANNAARVKGRKAKKDAIAIVGQAQKERNKVGRLWIEHLTFHDDKDERRSRRADRH
jgi:hypothetical protein